MIHIAKAVTVGITINTKTILSISIPKSINQTKVSLPTIELERADVSFIGKFKDIAISLKAYKIAI